MQAYGQPVRIPTDNQYAGIRTAPAFGNAQRHCNDETERQITNKKPYL